MIHAAERTPLSIWFWLWRSNKYQWAVRDWCSSNCRCWFLTTKIIKPKYALLFGGGSRNQTNSGYRVSLGVSTQMLFISTAPNIGFISKQRRGPLGCMSHDPKGYVPSYLLGWLCTVHVRFPLVYAQQLTSLASLSQPLPLWAKSGLPYPRNPDLGTVGILTAYSTDIISNIT